MLYLDTSLSHLQRLQYCYSFLASGRNIDLLGGAGIRHAIQFLCDVEFLFGWSVLSIVRESNRNFLPGDTISLNPITGLMSKSVPRVGLFWGKRDAQ